MLSEERQLLRWLRRLQADTPAIGDAVDSSQPGDLLHGRFAERVREVLAVKVCTLISGHELRPLLGEYGHEVLARAAAEMQHARPEAGGSCFSRGFDDRFEPIG